MATNTANYKLWLPSPSDYYNIEDFNRNYRIIDAALKALADAMSGTLLEKTVTIPVSAWQSYGDPDPENSAAYCYYYDILDESITADMEPTVHIDEASELIAAFAGMSSIADTADGYIRLQCVELPEADITLSCSLTGKIDPDIQPGEDAGGDSGEENEVPDGFTVATNEEVTETVEDALSGEYRASEGEPITSDEVATNEAVAEKMHGIFGI